jgi:NTE family protein
MDQGSKTALVLQGGGARGAYHVGVLAALAEITRARRSPFQIICGTSVGAINAASIAAAANDFQRGTKHLDSLWRGLRCNSIYNTDALSLLMSTGRLAGTMMFGYLGFRAAGGLLDYGPLRKLLEREFQRPLLQHAVQSKALHALCITASSYEGGQAVTFFEGAETISDWQRARRMGRRVQLTAGHILASAALPFAFAPVRVEEGYYGDGALRSTSPLSPAIRTGADRILVIGTRDTQIDTTTRAARKSGPTFGEVAGHSLDILFNDNLEADQERMLRINNTISLIPKAQRDNTQLRVIDSILLSPSQDLRTIAKSYASDLPRAVRMLLRSAGAWGGDGRLESYLLFEPGYVGDLIDLGYSDTMGQAKMIKAFFAGG